jgi:nucleoside phosphorylase
MLFSATSSLLRTATSPAKRPLMDLPRDQKWVRNLSARTAARAESRRDDWKAWASSTIDVDMIKDVKVLVGPIAAGEKVVASARSATFAFLRRHYSDALAVEMEGRGFLTAARANETRAIVVRGVSDLIEHKEETDQGGWQPRAAANAAGFDRCFDRPRSLRELGGVHDGCSGLRMRHDFLPEVLALLGS